jgi:alkylation response protein AidB-like acyl-CoA dehydrogenase
LEFKLNDEQKEILKAVKEFCTKEFTPECALEFDQKEEFPSAIYKKAAQLGFTSMRIPQEYDGQGYGIFEDCLVVEELCRADPGLGVAVSLGNLMIPDVLLKHGTEEQKKRYIPPLARGDKLAAAAFTEPEHGSDITRMVQPAHRGQSLFIAEKGMSGLEATKLHGKMGIKPCTTGSVAMCDLKVPETNVIGELGKGFYYTLELFDGTRITVAAQAVGMAQGAFDRALAYAKTRKQFGQTIINFQGIGFKLAEMAWKVESARLMMYKAAWYYDKEKPNPIATSMAKAYASRVAMEVTDDAIQVFGGYGYLADYHVERYHRCAKITEIYEGTSEIQKLTIANYLMKQQ